MSGWGAQRRREFPLLSHYSDLCYLDSAATAQKPEAVIKALHDFFVYRNAPLHRGIYSLSASVTMGVEEIRAQVQRFIGARDPKEIVFVGNATEGINLVAESFAKPRLEPGDNIVVSVMEHHANFVPWQQICRQTGAEFRAIPLAKADPFPSGLDLAAAEQMLDRNTKMLAVCHASNVLGTVNPVEELTALARRRGIPVLLDGAQMVVHGPVDVAALDCDFYVFSGHKLYGPDGIGVLYGRRALLEAMRPYRTGGDMVELVSLEETTFAHSPHRFEAGTMPVSQIFGLSAALDYLDGLGWDSILAHEKGLLEQMHQLAAEIPGLRAVGQAESKVGVFSFVMEGIHPHDIATILDTDQIAIRVGHHCAQPLMRELGVPATARASLGLYNSVDDLDRFYNGLKEVLKVMK